jgi:hypothetical protein
MSPEEVARRDEYVAMMAAKDAARAEQDASRGIANDAQHAAEEAAETVRKLAQDLDKNGKSMSFDQRVKERKRMLKAKEESDRLADFAKTANADFEQVKFNTTAALNGGVGKKGFSDGLEAEAEGFSQVGEKSLICWLLGANENDNIGDCYFGNFTDSDEPPTSDWLAFDDSDDLAVDGNNENHGCPLEITDPFHKSARVRPNKKQVKAFVIKFGTRKVNGKYVQDGIADGVPKFINAEGVCLFRTRLYETPELGITVESMKHVQVTSSFVLIFLPYAILQTATDAWSSLESRTRHLRWFQSAGDERAGQGACHPDGGGARDRDAPCRWGQTSGQRLARRVDYSARPVGSDRPGGRYDRSHLIPAGGQGRPADGGDEHPRTGLPATRAPLAR